MTVELNEEEELMLSCAKNIVKHLERNIVKHRDQPKVAFKLSAMNKHIQQHYILGY